ncbi:MAG TPA: glucose 1-dehydrogenase [Candidatus Dormibacteraeota bacterium]|jgi:NAD(P)-dependent dehydrogenase (short-subunit alcohol dehydrogenase family)|nr:glucose 1-dehydrogenase [Candidatus Dormibacteraeota bacterium]
MGLEAFSLEGKTALVTGASRGIGEEIAVAYAEAGADLALVARSASELERVADRVRNLGRQAVAIPCDVGNWDEIDAGVELALADLGRIDVLVNNAGGPVFNAPLLDYRDDGFRRIVELNLFSVARFCQKVGAHMVERGTGSVINNTSVTTFKPFPTQTAYGAAKAGVLSLTLTLAQEWGPSGVRVNAFGPGWIKTHINRKVLATRESAEAAVSAVPLRRWGEAGEVAGVAVFLASDASSYVTGAHISVDGGLSLAWPQVTP